MAILIPFILSTLAGLSTLLGIIFIYIKASSEKIIKYSLAFSAGVMICMSMIDLIPESINLLNESMIKNISYLYLLLAILLGMLLPFIIDKILNKNENELYRVGVLSLLAIIAHNIPEGIATYLSAQINIKLGFKMAIAIALHNIPEGISIIIPLYYGSKNKRKAIIMTIMSALSEPLGALLAFLFLKPIITNKIMGIILGMIAGIMSYISVIELLPESLEYKEKKKTIAFFMIGIIFMYISINLMK